MIIKINYY